MSQEQKCTVPNFVFRVFTFSSSCSNSIILYSTDEDSPVKSKNSLEVSQQNLINSTEWVALTLIKI